MTRGRAGFTIVREDRCRCGALLGKSVTKVVVGPSGKAVANTGDGGTIPPAEARSKRGADGAWHAWNCPTAGDPPS